MNQCQRRKLTALTIRKAARDATHVSEEESQLREILAKAESWAARAKSLKPATCAGGLTEIPHEKLMAAPTLAQLKKLVDQGESLAIDCTIHYDRYEPPRGKPGPGSTTREMLDES